MDRKCVALGIITLAGAAILRLALDVPEIWVGIAVVILVCALMEFGGSKK